MASEHVLHTQLSVDECKDRLRAKVQMATFFPEMRGKAAVGGVRRNRFWVQDSREAGSRYQYSRSVFYGRLVGTADGGTDVIGHYARSTVGRLSIVFGVIGVSAVTWLAVAMALKRPFELRNLGWLLFMIAWVAMCVLVEIRCSRNRRDKMISFLRRVLDAKPVENGKDALVRH